MMVALTEKKIKELTEVAKSAMENAYAPYSKFKVGAALLASDGGIYSGCNVENASFGLTICAERNAVFQAVADGKREFVAVVIFTTDFEPTMPCGACRQVLYEFSDRMKVVSVTASGLSVTKTLDLLLPDPFSSESANSNLGKESKGR